MLSKLTQDPRFDLTVIVFGSHLLKKFGLTKNEIEQDGFGEIIVVPGMPQSDSPFDISNGYGDIVKAFAGFWANHQFDWVVALGDRFEMSAAVQASIPFEVKIAHLHGGETTLGATDNIYRHQISLASKIHFVAEDTYCKRVVELVGSDSTVYNVGALSLADLNKSKLPSWKMVCQKFDIPYRKFVLITFHPETIDASNNEKFIQVIGQSLKELSNDFYLVVTMTNADVNGSVIREALLKLKSRIPDKISLIENFGRENYFAAMQECEFLMGNTSSGIVEAASFQKFVINVGDRQKGRLRNKNIIDVPFVTTQIMAACKKAQKMGTYFGANRFYKANTVENIIEKLAYA